MSLMMLVFWGGSAWVLVTVLRSGGRRGDGRALEILSERLARGEITPEEYRELRETLER